MSDILLDSALKFKSLLDINYVLTFGRKNKSYNIIITFNEDNFCHLAGLHKLIDMPHLKKGASANFNKILNRKLTYCEISRSHHINKIEDRLRILSKLESILNLENTNWKYCQSRVPFESKIKADFLIEHQDKFTTSYIFIKKNPSGNLYSCNSCFEFKRNDYTIGQTRITLLESLKFYKPTVSYELLYRRVGYNPPLNKL